MDYSHFYMNILTKHKKNGLEGLKKFVQFLEIAPEQKARDILSMALLEDPVYMKWVMANMISFDFIKTLDGKELEKIYLQLANPIPTFVYALYKSEMEASILEKFNDSIRGRYKEELSLTKEVQRGKQIGCRNTIIEKIRALQKNRDITPFEWKIPEEKILLGPTGIISKDNQFSLFFENGQPALRGGLEKKLRAGLWKHYYPNGKLMAEGIYVDGEKMGEWKFYYADERIKAQGEFVENLKHGTWYEFEKDGKKVAVKYNRGRKDGEASPSLSD